MIEFKDKVILLTGSQGVIEVKPDDQITIKLAMLYEGECEGLNVAQCAEKFNYSRQRYYQLLATFRDQGSAGLISLKRGPKGNYRRSDQAVRDIIRYRFLDPDLSSEVIAQKLIQSGKTISTRSVERVITEYGLQKKSHI
jgi:transposase